METDQQTGESINFFDDGSESYTSDNCFGNPSEPPGKKSAFRVSRQLMSGSWSIPGVEKPLLE